MVDVRRMPSEVPISTRTPGVTTPVSGMFALVPARARAARDIIPGEIGFEQFVSIGKALGIKDEKLRAAYAGFQSFRRPMRTEEQARAFLEPFRGDPLIMELPDGEVRAVGLPPDARAQTVADFIRLGRELGFKIKHVPEAAAARAPEALGRAGRLIAREMGARALQVAASPVAARAAMVAGAVALGAVPHNSGPRRPTAPARPVIRRMR